MREIPQRELRNNISAVLREVEAGESMRVTVRGRPVADLVPVAGRKQGLSPDEVSRIVAQAPLDPEVSRIVAQAPLDPGFARDLGAAVGAMIDEL